ncbi:MAG: hypothetical protein QG673_1511 [Pseudomonadota bacterium]|nr:hypothetical protein [Pseudomonadota bacterium]
MPTEKDKSNAERAAYKTHRVKKVWNYLTVGPNEDSKDIAKDALLTSKAKGLLIAQKGVNANNIKVVTSDNVIYLLGNNPGKPAQINAVIEDIKEMDDSIKGVVNLIGK